MPHQQSQHAENKQHSTIWNKIIQQKLFYLFFFTIGSSVTLIISIFFSGQTLITIKIIEIVLLATAVIIKSFQVFKKLTPKQLLKTQIQFPIPYLFTVVNIFLLFEVCNYLNTYNPVAKSINVEYAIIESFRFFFMTYMCSLITNKKTTSKVQYWYYTAILIIVVCCDVYIIVLKVRVYGSQLDRLGDDLEQNLISYINKSISQQTYENFKKTVGNQQTALENASNLDIACVASVVANYLVMMDVIARPIQKIKQTSHLLHQVHTSLKGSISGKSDMSQKLLDNNVLVNNSVPQSDRSQSQRGAFEKGGYQNNRKSNLNGNKRNTNLELEQRKSNL